MGRGIPLGTNLLPVEKPVPVARVWVLAGRGTGTAENTHGLPVQNTIWFKVKKGPRSIEVQLEQLQLL
jgi:hypothetical protein